MIRSILTGILFLVASTIVQAQTGSYYNSRQYQNDQYKSLANATQRAFTAPDRPYSSNTHKPATSSTTTSTAGSSSRSTTSSTVTNNKCGYSNIGGGDRVRRQNEAGNRNDALIEAWNKKVATFEQMSTGIDKTAANFQKLVAVAAKAGIDDYTARRMLGYTDPANPENNGRKTIKYSNGDVMTTDLVGGIATGNCTIKWSNGAIYEGDIVNGVLTGKGKMTEVEGYVYTGDIVNSEYHGKGVLTYPNGNKYTGQFKDGLFDGEGVFEAENATFTGDFIKDKADYGTIRFTSGNEFTGFVYHANGKIKPKVGQQTDKNYTYTGWFNEEGIREGYGQYQYTDGALTEGEYKNGELYNLGRYTGTNKQTIAGKMNYKGAQIYGLVNFEGKWYSGMLKDGKTSYLPAENNTECAAFYKEVSEYLEKERKRFNAVMTPKN